MFGIDTQGSYQFEYTGRAYLIHEFGGDGVDRIGQGCLKGKHAATIAAIGIAGAPLFGIAPFASLYTGFYIGNLVTRGVVVVLYSGGIYEGLEGRPHLASALIYLVVLEIVIADPAYPCLDVSILGIHGGDSSTQKALIVADRIVRGHYRIDGTMPGKYLHRCFLIERSTDFLVGLAFGLELCPALGTSHGAIHQFVYLLLGEFYEGESLILSRVILLSKGLLEVFHMLLYGLFGGSLHTRIYGGVYLQPIGIDVILATIGFGIVLSPFLHIVT